jgi:hypothetical protein
MAAGILRQFVVVVVFVVRASIIVPAASIIVPAGRSGQ